MPVYPGDEGVVVVEEEIAPRPDDSDVIGESATRVEWESGYAWVEASLETATDQDVFQVEVTDLSRLVIYSSSSAEVAEGEIETDVINVTLVDDSGNPVTATGAGEKGESRYHGIAAGNYFVVVNGSGNDVTNYWLSFEGMRLDDSGDIGPDATPLTLDGGYGGIDGLVDGEGDRDVFRIDLAEATDYFAVYGSADGELVTGWQLTVTDAAGNALTAQAPTEFQDPSVQMFGAVGAGTYYIVAEGSSAGDGSYWISVESVAPIVYDIGILDFTGMTGEDGVAVGGGEGEVKVEVVDGDSGQVYIRTLDLPGGTDPVIDPTDRDAGEVVDEGGEEIVTLDDVPVEVVRDGDGSGDEIFWTLGGVETTSTEGSLWQNADEPLDVNGDGHFGPLDIMIVINALDDVGGQDLAQVLPRGEASLAAAAADATSMMYPDVNGDGRVTPTDAIRLINAWSSSSSESDAAGTRLADWADPNLNVDDPTMDDVISEDDMGSGLWEGDAVGDDASGRLAIWHDPDAVDVDVPVKDYVEDGEEESSEEDGEVSDELIAVDEFFATIADAV